jgi:hypothetical protein
MKNHLSKYQSYNHQIRPKSKLNLMFAVDLLSPPLEVRFHKLLTSDSTDFDRLSAEKQIYEKSKAVDPPEEAPIQKAQSRPSSVSAESKILSPSPSISSPASMILAPTSGEVFSSLTRLIFRCPLFLLLISPQH